MIDFSQRTLANIKQEMLDQVEDKFREEYSNQPAPQYSARYIASVSTRHSRV